MVTNPRAARVADAGDDAPDLVLSYRQRRITAAGRRIPLPPADFAFYAMMVRRAAAGGAFINYQTPGLAQEYLDEYRRVTDEYGDAGKRDRVAARVQGLELALLEREQRVAYRNWFSERKAKVNRMIRMQLGNSHARTFEISRHNSRPNTVFGLDIERLRIRIVEAEP